MIITAIDPGTEQSAWVMRSANGMYVGNIVDNNRMLMEINCGMILQTDLLLIEKVEGFGMAVGKSVFQTVHWAGRFHQHALDNGIPEVGFVPRKEVKLTLCQSPRAKDANIRQALIDRFGGDKDTAIGKKASPGPLYGFKSHMWAALAVLETYRELREAA